MHVMLHGMNEQMVITDIRDWCTYAWAAEHMAVSIQQVGRYVKLGLLHVQSPRCGKDESSRRLLQVEEVKAFQRARVAVGRG